MSTRLLLLEDDPAIARTVAYALERDGLQVTHCLLVQDARQQMQRHPFDLLVLDVGLPDGNGLDLLRDVRHGQAAAALRLRQATPVLMLSARGEELDRVLGLELGADDYLAKPFSPRELAARIKAVLRRRAPETTEDAVEIGGLRLDPATHRLTADGKPVNLGPTEFRLLHFLMTHPERVHSRAQLLDQVWGDHVFVEERTVDVHIRRLRSALEPSNHDGLVQTVRGSGYRLSTQQETATTGR